MIQLNLIFFSSILSIIFFQSLHPLVSGAILIAQTILLCMITGSLAQNLWFSYILFLIFLGGLLVLFIYVIVLASNEMFSFSMKSLALSSSWFVFLCSISMTFMNFMWSMDNNKEMNDISHEISSLMENSWELEKLYSFPSSLITLMLVTYLLITLIAAVKITNLFYGPLRKMN